MYSNINIHAVLLCILHLIKHKLNKYEKASSNLQIERPSYFFCLFVLSRVPNRQGTRDFCFLNKFLVSKVYENGFADQRIAGSYLEISEIILFLQSLLTRKCKGKWTTLSSLDQFGTLEGSSKPK